MECFFKIKKGYLVKKLLLTGFEAYASTSINPAEQVAKALDNKVIANMKIISTVVPNTFYKSIEHVKNIMASQQFDYVLMMGEYQGRSMITFERFAHNLMDSSRYQLKDNDGVSYDQKEVISGGPIAYQSHLPLKAMVESVRKAGVPANISDTAGTFVCNHLYYGILHETAVNKLPIKVGWAHLPMLPSTAALVENLGQPSMCVQTATQGITAAIKAIAHYPKDIKQSICAGLQI